MPRPTQAELLLALATDLGVELWRDTLGDAWATIPVGASVAPAEGSVAEVVAGLRAMAAAHAEHHRVASRAMRRWMSTAYYASQRRPPSAQALTDALGVLEGQALATGDTHPTHLRVASDGLHVYLDMGDPEWHAVEVTPGGWSIISSQDVPVRFRRSRGLRPLPVPERGGSLEDLRELLGVGDDAWTLLAGWLVGAVAPEPPYLVLCLAGEQGAGKSVRARMLRRVIDPHVVELRRPPRDERDCAIAASNSWVVALDNLSGLPPWLSDTLCCVASGGGYATRTLYTDADETLVEVARPVVLTGIEPAATRGDLLDRSVIVSLPAPTEHVPERELWAQLEAVEGRVLGALLDAASAALRHRSETRAPGDLRMADAARWISAAEPALPWEAGAWEAAYRAARGEARSLAVEASPVAAAALALVRELGGWDGTAAELLRALAGRVDDRTTRSRAWPGTARGLAGALRRAAPDLRALGVAVAWWRTADARRQRMVRLAQIDGAPDRPDGPDRPNRPQGADLGPDGRPDGMDGRSDGGRFDRPAASARDGSGLDGMDGSDGCAPHPSTDEPPPPRDEEAPPWAGEEADSEPVYGEWDL